MTWDAQLDKKGVKGCWNGREDVMLESWLGARGDQVSAQQGFTWQMFHLWETAPPRVGAAFESCRVPLS